MEALVFRALASRHRRRILDLLREGPRTTGELDARLGGLSRFAVMQHLGVLEEAGLVVSRKEGRRRLNHLNAVPLREVYERWVNRFADEAAAGALALRRRLESEGGARMGSEVRSIRIENEIRLRAPVERCFRAFTDEQLDWYPYSYGGDRVKVIAFEANVGGRVYEDWGDGAGVLYGHVAYFDPPKAVCIRSHLRPAINLEQWAVFDTDGEETVLKQSMTAFGDISDEMASAIRSHGDLSLVEDKLRAWVEQGQSARAG